MFEVFTGVVRTSPIPEGHVSISPRGSIALATDLARCDLNTHFAEFAYDGTSQQIRLRLMSQAGTSGYCWRFDKRRWRVEPLAAMKLFGLCPPSRTFCPAKWSGDSLMVELGRQAPADQIAISPDRPANGRPPSDDGGLPAPTPPKGPSKYGVRWAGGITCPNCGKEVAYRWVKGRAFLRKHTDCDATLLPEGYADERPPSATLTTLDLPKAAADAVDRRQCVCSVCGQRVQVSTRSGDYRPMAHRIDGKIYKGTFQSPLPDEAESES
jgi:hypothetical protein